MKKDKKYYQTLFLLLALLIAYSIQLYATVRFVSKTGNNTPPYTTWETAADSIQKCINISVFGDTIYVANGVYQERVVMIPGLSLIGAGMDSCVIDTRSLVTSQNYRCVETADSSLITGFHILVYNNSTWGIGMSVNGMSLVEMNKVSYANQGILNGSNTLVRDNIFTNVTIGMALSNSNAIIKNNHIYTDPNSSSPIVAGIDIEAFTDEYAPLIDSNYIIVGRGQGIRKDLGASPTIRNNIILLEDGVPDGIRSGIGGNVKIFNNLIVQKLATMEYTKMVQW